MSKRSKTLLSQKLEVYPETFITVPNINSRKETKFVSKDKDKDKAGDSYCNGQHVLLMN